MSARPNAGTAGGAQLVGTPGRPARAADSGRGEHAAESVLSLNSGAGSEHFREECVDSARPPARHVRFEDPARNAAYWERVTRIVDAAPPLTDDQRARIRAAFFTPTTSSPGHRRTAA